MNATEAFARLKALGVPVFRTAEASAILHTSTGATHKTLMRLSEKKLVISIRKGLWALGSAIDPIMLPEFLTAPYSSYVSLQTALYLHGMISQIPQVIYAVSLARTQRIKTSVGQFSIHHINPEFFFGYNVVGENGIKLATPEKALLDIFYLAGRRGEAFAALPELELPSGFRIAQARAWARRIPSQRDRTLVAIRLKQSLNSMRKHL